MNLAFVVIIVGISAYLGAKYYLEKKMNTDQIFYIFSALALLFGVASLGVVVTNGKNFEYYISIASVFTLISIMYYNSGDKNAQHK